MSFSGVFWAVFGASGLFCVAPELFWALLDSMGLFLGYFVVLWALLGSSEEHLLGLLWFFLGLFLGSPENVPLQPSKEPMHKNGTRFECRNEKAVLKANINNSIRKQKTKLDPNAKNENSTRMQISTTRFESNNNKLISKANYVKHEHTCF